MASRSKTSEPSSSASSASSPSEVWKERIIIPTILAGVVGGGVGLLSKHRKVHGIANITATYAANFAIVAGCYCGAREFVRASRASEPGDLINSAIGGFGSGALLGRLQGGQLGAIRYSIMFAIAGTTLDFAAIKLKPVVKSFSESMFGDDESLQKNGAWLRWPEWSPIQVLDKEAVAAKKAREQQLYAKGALGKLNKEES
ncbi:uncharacterized protein LOC131155458 [Malania oleifera]|uniref:uncharacterized protein LOC131155458 n=1 Tax=Malania oleifera TaxID=397392 RepID=UPI0025ADDB27|nr:uncharacterized protein LOC131155458 [Malania oleifera]